MSNVFKDIIIILLFISSLRAPTKKDWDASYTDLNNVSRMSPFIMCVTAMNCNSYAHVTFVNIWFGNSSLKFLLFYFNSCNFFRYIFISVHLL
jgi:hypothetical protein